MRHVTMKWILFGWLIAMLNLKADAIGLVLPTENHHLFSGNPERFYMYVDRTFEGEVSKPWEGGAFGFVRTPLRVNGEVVLTKFHEGIDIAPIKRDKAGNPLDLILSIADGKVVYTSQIAGRSNYGRYLVVEHDWEQSKVYSLYAHLAEITVQVGAPVKAGSVLGRMGYTGAGINRTRAHLHLELGFKMSLNYESWHQQNFASPNHHANFNGMNLAGVDVAGFFLAHRENPELRFSEFVMSQPVQFKVAVPAGKTEPEFLTRYPWMKLPGDEEINSWEIGFSATGHIISFTPSKRAVQQAVVTHIRPAEINQSYLTRGLISGKEHEVSLSRDGKRLVSLILDDFPIAP
jgi:murein DD-endopeptidase MepM/ murein hydrolase activator NlpD